jgi:DNA-binding transcriptional ArsR family regulator
MRLTPLGRMAPAHLDATFAALADPTRRAILDALLDEIKAATAARRRNTATIRQAARRRRP